MSDAKHITEELFKRIGVGRKPVQEAITVSYRASINRLSVDFPSNYAPNNEKVHSNYLPGAMVPMWMEIALQIFDRYYTLKEQGHGD